MNFLNKALLFILSLSSAIYMLYNINISANKIIETMRVLQTTTEEDQYINNSTFIEELYTLRSCNQSITTKSILDEAAVKEAVPRLSSFFRFSGSLSTSLEQYIIDNKDNLDTILNEIAVILIPLFSLILLSLVGWFTCCSCCCYDYCPIICKRKDRNAPYETTSKFVPIILVMFSGFSLIIPSVLAFLNFK